MSMGVMESCLWDSCPMLQAYPRYLFITVSTLARIEHHHFPNPHSYIYDLRAPCGITCRDEFEMGLLLRDQADPSHVPLAVLTSLKLMDLEVTWNGLLRMPYMFRTQFVHCIILTCQILSTVL
jgi:hypothetical protein